MQKGYVASKSKSTKFLLCAVGLPLAAATFYSATVPSVSAQAVPGTTVRAFSITAVGPHNIALGSYRGQFVNPAGSASGLDATGSVLVNTRGAAMNISRNAGTARITTSIQTDATAPSVLITTTQRTGTVTYTSGGVTKIFPRDADALGRIIFPLVQPTPVATPTPASLNTVVVSGVTSNSNADPTSFAPTSRKIGFIGASKEGAQIDLTKQDASGALRNVSIRASTRTGLQIGRAYPIRNPGSGGTDYVFIDYSQRASSQANTFRWSAQSGTFVLDSISGDGSSDSICRFRIINARMKGSVNEPSTTFSYGDFTLNFNGTATAQE